MIGVLAHIGNLNLGDEAIVGAVLQNVRARRPDEELFVLTINPADTASRHRVRALPLRRAGSHAGAIQAASTGPRPSLAQARARLAACPVIGVTGRHALRAIRSVAGAGAEARFLAAGAAELRKTKLMLVAGSAQLFDYFGGPWGFPFTLFKWALLCRLHGCPIAFLSMGAGPILAPLSRLFLRTALRLGSYRSYRDQTSHEVASSLGLPATDRVVPDLAFSLDAASPPTPLQRPTVAINPMPFFAPYYWPESHPAVYRRYLDNLAAFTRWLTRRGLQVLLFPTQLKADSMAIDDLLESLNASSAVSPWPFQRAAVSDLDDLLAHLAQVRFVVATRFHAAVFACILHKPLLAISYHHKTSDLMSDLGLSAFVEPASTLSADSLRERFVQLQAAEHQVCQTLSHRVSAYRHTLGQQYDAVLALASSTSARRRVTREPGQQIRRKPV